MSGSPLFPAGVRTDRQFWEAACSVAGLRSGFHQGRRGASRDRGDQQNLLGDIIGAAAELAVLAHLEQARPLLDPRYVAVSFEAPEEGPDLLVSGGRYEIKAFPLAERSKWALVNERTGLPKMIKHQVRAVLPTFVIPGAQGCVIGTPIAVSDIQRWPMAPGWVSRTDPARGLPIDQLISRVTGRHKCQVEGQLRRLGPAIETDKLIARASAVRSRYARAAQRSPMLQDLPYSELCHELRSAVEPAALATN